MIEKAEKIAMVPAGFGWSDLGSWDAIAGAHEADENGNSAIGADKVQFIDARNHIGSIGLTEKVMAAIGIKNLVSIETPDALLVEVQVGEYLDEDDDEDDIVRLDDVYGR